MRREFHVRFYEGVRVRFPRATQLVITMGGYHPRFRVPEHYPWVPRLGFNWRIGDTVTIKGEEYFALCAHAVMAGGCLQVSFESGDAHASFRASADFLIGWKPYHYDIELRVGVSAGYGFLGDVDVSVGLRLWEPEFGGCAEIDVTLFSFTIEFGDQSSRYPKAIDWDEFQEGFLPPGEEICSIAVTSGLIRRAEWNGQEIWVVNPKDLALATDAFVPTKQGFQGEARAALDTTGANAGFGVRPMAVKPDDIGTEHWIKITKITDDGDFDVADQFVFPPVKRQVPSAVWSPGEPHPTHPDRIVPPGEDDDRFLEGVVTGFEIKAKAQPAPGDTEDILSENLQYDTTPVADAFPVVADHPVRVHRRRRRGPPRATARDRGPEHRAGPAARSAGFQHARDVSIDAGSLAQSFVVAPEVQ